MVKDTFALAIGMKIVRGLTDISSKKEVINKFYTIYIEERIR